MYDIIAHSSTNISYIHDANFSLCKRMTSTALALKALRLRTVPKISSRSVAKLLDMQPSSYAFYEDANKFKKPLLPLDLAKKLADIFEERGVPKSETLALAGLTGELSNLALTENKDDNEWVEVRASVAAGVWKEQSEWPVSERYEVKFGPSRYPDAERFGLRMEGLSMNRTIPHGMDLECIRIMFSRYEPKPGDYVIVERLNHDLTETTCKRLDRDGDEYVLRCESYEPEFQEEIRLGSISNDLFVDDEIKIIGIVVGAKLDLAQAGLSERRFKYI